jgi:beta-lactamase class A
MGIGGTTTWRAVSALAVATLAAGLVGGLGGATVRAEMRALVAPAAARSKPPATVPAPVGRFAAGGGRAPAGSPADEAQAAVAAAVALLTAGRPADSVSVAALDTTTGMRVGWGADSGVTTASVFKLLLLEGYLLQNQDRGEAPGDGAADALASMVENSDNDAADQVYAALGGPTGVVSTLTRLGLSGTALGPEDQWGLSTTGAADQLTALTDLVSPQSPLSSASRAYAIGLMSDVESDQRWGVDAAADPDTDFANKNGWLDVDDDGGRWVASSVGVIKVGGHQVLLAVLTQHDTDLADGVDLVESLSRTVATTLRNAA